MAGGVGPTADYFLISRTWTTAIEADNLSPQKARVLLMVAMTHATDVESLREYFAR